MAFFSIRLYGISCLVGKGCFRVTHLFGWFGLNIVGCGTVILSAMLLASPDIASEEVDVDDETAFIVTFGINFSRKLVIFTRASFSAGISCEDGAYMSAQWPVPRVVPAYKNILCN